MSTGSQENKNDDEDFRVELLPEDYAQYDLSFKIIVIGDSRKKLMKGNIIKIIREN